MKISYDKQIAAAIAMGLALSLSACGETADQPTKDPVAQAQAEAAASDPNAINSPFSDKEFSGSIKVSGDATVSPDGKSVNIPIEVTNNGTVAIYSVGKHPVNVGISVLGDDGTVTGAGGSLDFVRAQIPLIQPGQSANVNAVIPVDPRVSGRKIRFTLVQEGAKWLDGDSQSLVYDPAIKTP